MNEEVKEEIPKALKDLNLPFPYQIQLTNRHFTQVNGYFVEVKIEHCPYCNSLRNRTAYDYAEFGEAIIKPANGKWLLQQMTVIYARVMPAEDLSK